MVHARAVVSVQVNGPALRLVRELVGVSCSALARDVGTDVSFLARVERGEKRGINRETFHRIVMRLGVTDERALLVNPYGTPLVPNVAHTGPTVVPCKGKTRTAA